MTFLVPTKDTYSPRNFQISPVDDPWFKATSKTTQKIANSNLYAAPMQMFTASNPVSVLGCLEDTELCNPSQPDGSACKLLPTECNIIDETASLHLNGKQKATVERLYEAISRTSLSQSVYYLGGSGLLAATSIEDNLSPGLPENQWTLEAKNWFATSLTALQLWSIQFVTGFGRQSFNAYITPPLPADEWMCRNQVVQRGDFASFSVLGLATIIVVCGLIIVLSEGLSRILPRIATKSVAQRRRDEEWQAYDILKLERSNSKADKRTAVPPLSVSASHVRPTSNYMPSKEWLLWRWPFRRTLLRRESSAEVSPLSTTGLLHGRPLTAQTSADAETDSPSRLEKGCRLPAVIDKDTGKQV